MSYPYTNQGVEAADKKPGFRTGRVLFIDDITAFTPREFFKFIDEGFLPVIVDGDGSGAEFSVAFGYDTSLDDSVTTYRCFKSSTNYATSTDLDISFSDFSSHES